MAEKTKPETKPKLKKADTAETKPKLKKAVLAKETKPKPRRRLVKVRAAVTTKHPITYGSLNVMLVKDEEYEFTAEVAGWLRFSKRCV